MSTEVVKTEGELAIPSEGMTGLEDFDMSTDSVMPTIRIEHNEGVFVDGLSGETFSELTGVLLGLIKQRVLWDTDMDDSAKGPLCRSYNFKEGHPSDRFPWKATGWSPDVLKDTNTLPCERCPLQEWGSHPQRDTPWCSEQHTFAFLQQVEGGMVPALLTVQRSAIKPSKTYLTSFARSNVSPFTVVTKITLEQRKKGSVNFAVPKFVRAEATDASEWPEYARQYRQIREFVQTPRVREDDDVVVEAVPPTPAPPVATTPTPVSASVTPTGSAASAVPPSVAEDDLPF